MTRTAMTAPAGPGRCSACRATSPGSRTGTEPWSVWDICCAFADQYEKMYEDPERHGVWSHDLTDLWIERLVYFPQERLLYAWIGS